MAIANSKRPIKICMAYNTVMYHPPYFKKGIESTTKTIAKYSRFAPNIDEMILKTMWAMILKSQKEVNAK